MLTDCHSTSGSEDSIIWVTVELLCYKLKINTILYINYPSIKVNRYIKHGNTKHHIIHVILRVRKVRVAAWLLIVTSRKTDKHHNNYME